jgi:acyl-CoA reductase-like NAD-dependent aldehyde dehydrogenase
MHRDRVATHLKAAEGAGAEVLTGGAAPDDPGLAGGYYLQPAVLRAEPDSQMCQDEVFDPVVTVSTFRTEEEAIAFANGTEYGLGGGLWTTDLSRAHRVAARDALRDDPGQLLQAGQSGLALR